MAIWQRKMTLAELNQLGRGNLAETLGIVFTAINEETLEATLPVDSRTRQPFGLLHGGASVALAETLGSVAGYLCTSGEERIVGLGINASHLRPVREGEVRGVCRALHIGRNHQRWQIDIFDPRQRLCCSVRLTTAVLSARGKE